MVSEIEHSVGKGGVVSSILTGSTKFPKHNGRLLCNRFCPLCSLDTKRSTNTTFQIVGNTGDMFTLRTGGDR